jgi:hypothetical protein
MAGALARQCDYDYAGTTPWEVDGGNRRLEVDGSSLSRRPPRRKTDPRVADGHLMRIRPRR